MQILFYLFSLLILWFASELMIRGVDNISKRLRISSFAGSFFILGILTAIPEFAIGVQAIANKQPEIFAGEIIGSSFIIFLFIIPLLAIFSNGIKFYHHLSDKDFFFSLFVILIPTIFSADGQHSWKGGFFMILSYFILFYILEKGRKITKAEKTPDKLNQSSFFQNLVHVLRSKEGLIDLGKMALGTFLIFFSSKLVVSNTLSIAEQFNIAPYVMSLIILSIGSNLPEIFLAVNSIIKKRQEFAFGDYIGTSAANTAVFGLLIFINGPFRIESSRLIATVALYMTGLLLFYIFSRSNRDISRREGFLLISIYIIFVVIEIFL